MAELAGAAHGAQAAQFDVRCEVILAHRLLVHQRGAEVFLVVVREDGDDRGVVRDFVLGFLRYLTRGHIGCRTRQPRTRISGNSC